MRILKKLFQCMKYDFLEGVLWLYPIYLLEILRIVVFAALEWRELDFIIGTPSALELGIKLFEGMEVFEYYSGGPPLEIPMEYLVFCMLAGFPAVYYVKREWTLRGTLFLPRYQSKTIWWMSKCILGIMQVVVFYAIAFLALWLIAGIGGNWSMTIREEINMVCRKPLLIENAKEVFNYMYLLGACTIVAMNQMIMSMQLVFNPVVGYVLAMGVYIATSCMDAKYILGNHLMLLRTKVFTETGIGILDGVIFALLIWMLFVIIGWFMIRRKDVLS